MSTPIEKTPNSATIMLLPDDSYIKARPKTKDHHLTVAYFGKASTLDQRSMTRLTTTVNALARFAGGPIEAVANGVGMFNAGSAGVAVVDLIDGIGTFTIRSRVEKQFEAVLDGLVIDYTHGFTPHITREYLSREDDFYATVSADDIDDHKFHFIAVGLWAGDYRYEVAL